MTIHTVGDSHCYAGWTGVISHHLGPVLCYSFGKEPLERCDLRKYDLKEGDTIVFCFGEIDCRCHIQKHVTETVSYQEIIDQIVRHYFEAIETTVKASQVQLKKVCVYNVVPPVQKGNTAANHQYPYLGTDEERRNYTLYINQLLKEKCKEANYLFIDIYDSYKDESGFLRKDLSDGNVHIKVGTFLADFLAKHDL